MIKIYNNPQKVETIRRTSDPQFLVANIARMCNGKDGSFFPFGEATQEDRDLCKKLLKWEHMSPFEHASTSIKITTSRAIANELTRHRLMSFIQQSTRYITLTKDNEFHVVTEEDTFNNEDFWEGVDKCIKMYNKMIHKNNYSAEDARDILPLCTMTTLIATANARQWHHVAKLRTGKGAHPMMQRLMRDIVDNHLKPWFPELYESI